MIPVCEPCLGGNELEYVSDCIRSNWISSIGKYISQFEQKFAEYCGVKHGISTTSGTTALHLTLASLGIGKGDEVIVPAFTMVAPVAAIVYTGAKPVLVDCVRDTWNMDVAQIEKKITRNTKAVLPVHIYGHPCDMKAIMEITGAHKLCVIEDAAEAHGAECNGKKAGGIGDVSCFSFYANKIITTGEGGMVLTDRDDLADRARTLKDQAYSREKRFLHTEVGFNYRMTNIQAAIGLAQVEKIDQLVEKRRRNAALYQMLLDDVEGIQLPVEKEWAKNVYWMYCIVVQDEFGIGRDELAEKLKARGIDTRPFFIPMHQQPSFKKLGLFSHEAYPVSEDISRRGMYLPSGSGLTSSQIEEVCATLRRIGEAAAKRRTVPRRKQELTTPLS